MVEQLKTLKGPDSARQAAALVERMCGRPAVSNAGVRGRYARPRYRRARRRRAAGPVAPAKPINGAVDVSNSRDRRRMLR